MTIESKEGLNNILQAIENFVTTKSENLKFDKTYRAKVTDDKGSGVYTIQVNGKEYDINAGDNTLEVGNMVKAKVPLNNFSDIYVEGINGTNQAGIATHLSSDASLTATTFTTIKCDTVHFNKNIGYNSSTGIYTINQSGLYDINVFLRFGGGTGEYRGFVDIYISNGGSYTPVNVRSTDTQKMISTATTNISRTVYLQAGATLYASAYSTIANSIVGTSTYDNTSTQISIIKVGEYLT